jgi:thiosulfate dehydrogenase
MKRNSLNVVAAIILFGTLSCAAAEAQVQTGDLPLHPAVLTNGKDLVVQLCDGHTNLTVAGVSPNERLTPEQAQRVSDELMAAWFAKQPPAVVAAWQRENAAAKAAEQRSSQNPTLQAAATNEQPLNFSARDKEIWQRELEREIAYGNQLFHDDKLLGSTIGVPCAMCHPNAANTHPETYPKFQIQLKRVVLLRDMINWCLENPSQAPRLDPNDPKLHALEAYILSQRKGVAIEPGKH